MNWENLQTMTCPRCGDPMIEELPEIRCTTCRFHIDEARFKIILGHRKSPPDGHVRLKWQNLKDGSCPVCGRGMQLSRRHQGNVYRCAEQGCRFTIRESKVEAILADPSHPANRFYKPIQN